MLFSIFQVLEGKFIKKNEKNYQKLTFIPLFLIKKIFLAKKNDCLKELISAIPLPAMSKAVP
tara:strand:- start:656 stop:841 length:186 start_codon:yes stop_codon:yes gene_type:complete